MGFVFAFDLVFDFVLGRFDNRRPRQWKLVIPWSEKAQRYAVAPRRMLRTSTTASVRIPQALMLSRCAGI